MDVVSVTASLTALLTLAIQSTKVISQAVQQIRGGPVHVQHLAAKADALHQTLQQLSALINEAGLTSCSDVSGLFTNLQRLVEACAEDLKTLTRKLRCLQEAIGGNHVRRAWAVFKALVGEKELEHMWKVLQSHRETLNSQLIIISTRLGIDHNQRLQQMNELLGISSNRVTVSLEEVSRETKDVQHRVTECFNRLEGSLEVEHSSFQNLRNESSKEEVKALNRLERNLQGLSSDFGSQLDLVKQQNQLLSQASSQAADHLSTKIENLSKLSQEQSETIIQLLRQIQQQSKSHHVEDYVAASTGTAHSTAAQAYSFDPHQHVDGDSRDTIDRLCLLASKKPQTLTSDEAQTIIEDLVSLLSIVIAKEEDGKALSLPENNGKRKRDLYSNPPDGKFDKQYSRDAKRVQRILSASQSITVNEKPKGGRRILSVKGRALSRGESREYRTEYGTIRVDYTVKQAMEMQGHRGLIQEPDSLEVTEIFYGSFSLLPAAHNKYQTKLCASFCQAIMKEQCSVLHPLMSFYSVRPDNSPVFQIVKSDDLNEFIRLLDTKDASPKDCDTRGRSLLNYALASLSTSVSAFLIDHGADVNAVEESVDPEFRWNCPLLNQLRWSYHNSDSGKVMRCQQLLLDADADPNMCMNTTSGCSVFMNVVRYSCIVRAYPHCTNVQAHADDDKESVRMYMNFTGHLIDLECGDALGSTALLICIETLYNLPVFGKDVLHKVTLLLDRGANIMAQDRSGKGVFHHLFPYEDCAFESGGDVWLGKDRFTEDVAWIETHELMRLLLQKGADIHAVDSNRCSVSQAAYGAGLGAVWYRALLDTGRDAEETFSHLYEEFPEARCPCGRPRVQKRLYHRSSPWQVYVKNILDCTHNEEFREGGNRLDVGLSTIDGIRSNGVSPVLQKDKGYEIDEDWGIDASDPMAVEGSTSPILEGSW